LGDGVQLYDVTQDGRATILLSNQDTVIVGGSEGLVNKSTEEPRKTGVLSYEWAPDGNRFWYSRIRLRAGSEQQEMLDHGLHFDDQTMVGATMLATARAVQLLGTELHVVDQKTGTDRVIAFAPADIGGDSDVFRREAGSAKWVDSTHIQYRLRGVASGYSRFSLWRVDALTGERNRLAMVSPDQIYYSVPTQVGILTVIPMAGEHHLVNLTLDGRVATDYGSVPFERIGGELGVWREDRGERIVLAVHFDDYDGLTARSSGSRWAPLSTSHDHLSACTLNSDLSFGVCSRESLARAPELVSFTRSTGKISIVARPNARYDEIEPLRTIPGHWINRYGSVNTGYITYPRDYVAGKKYPAIVVTHARDARNWFAQDAFQWEFPIQVYAERGYFVLSVNEPADNGDIPPPYFPGASSVGVAMEQFHEAYNPLASIEAAVDALVKGGSVEPSKIGIAGYSRGSTIARFAIAHSAIFSAASSADAAWWDAGGFWAGSAFSRNLYRNLLGGGPFDPAAYPNYVAFSPSARARSFAGPLLQQFTLGDANEAVEMDQLLKDAQVPTELFFYPSEAHIFWHPRHRASAMARNLDWFDFWLMSRRDPDPDKSAQYNRWDELAAQWRTVTEQRERDALTSGKVISGGSPNARQ
jgi:dipeptidyl aminopeptidase/acylaminoacyl peptidase